MAIGERIRFIRNLRGMTQKYLGMTVGFDEKTADIRMAQYESGTRTPKADLTKKISNALEVSPDALNVPNIDSDLGLIHTLFALEDIYGLEIENINGKICLCFDENKIAASDVIKMLTAWSAVKEKLNSGEIDKDSYDEWRYKYPQFDETGLWKKIPSKEFSDAFLKYFSD